MLKYINNKRGGTLVLVLMATVVLSILGIALLSTSVAETRFAVHQEKRQQAYYIARSGAEAVAAWLRIPSNNASTLLNATPADTYLGAGKFIIEIVDNNPITPKIKSIGIVDGIRTEVILTLKQISVFENAIYANSLLFLHNNCNVTGSIEIGSSGSITGNLTNVHGEIHYDSDKQFDDLTIPTLAAHTPTNWNVSNGTVVNSASPYSNKSYTNISIGSSVSQLDFNLSGDMAVVVTNELDVNNSNINVTGSGNLFIYTNKFDFRGNLYSSNTANVFIVLNNGGSAELKTGNSVFQGYIYGPNAAVKISANLSLTGAIIANSVSMESGGTVTYSYTDTNEIFGDALGLSPMGYRKSKWN